MDLETLVAPLELCKQIPAGCFDDSALVWFFDGSSWWVNAREFEATSEQEYPAPTLTEILEALPTRIPVDGLLCSLQLLDTRNKPWEDWQVGYARETLYGLIVSSEFRERDKNPATAALRLWLKINKTQTQTEER